MGGYFGGMIIVAANSAEEASKTLHNDSSYNYLYRQLTDGDYEDYYYDIKDWEEVPCLNYDKDTPCVIAEEGYTE